MTRRKGFRSRTSYSKIEREKGFAAGGKVCHGKIDRINWWKLEQEANATSGRETLHTSIAIAHGHRLIGRVDTHDTLKTPRRRPEMPNSVYLVRACARTRQQPRHRILPTVLGISGAESLLFILSSRFSSQQSNFLSASIGFGLQRVAVRSVELTLWMDRLCTVAFILRMRVMHAVFLLRAMHALLLMQGSQMFMHLTPCSFCAACHQYWFYCFQQHVVRFSLSRGSSRGSETVLNTCRRRRRRGQLFKGLAQARNTERRQMPTMSTHQSTRLEGRRQREKLRRSGGAGKSSVCWAPTRSLMVRTMTNCNTTPQIMMMIASLRQLWTRP